MRLKHSWIFSLLLTGCQLTQQTENQQSSSQSINHLSEQVPSQMTKKLNNDIQPPASPQSQEDLWQRIALQLQLSVPNNKMVDYYRTWYLTNPSHLKTVSERAQPFLYLITEKIEQRGLPLELALLPIVESSFDAFAYSHGSAAGLWQFVPETGKYYGLKQNYWYDGRRDVAASTDAALDYLTTLNTRFDGNWNHTIAAYNSGGGRVSSAIRKNQKLGKPTDFFSLDLPEETSGYVPKLLALADIIANQDKYDLDIPPIANQPVVELIDPKEQLDLAIAARYAGISVKQLQSLNPAYNQWATAPNGPHQLLLPVNSIEKFNNNVSENRGKGMKLVRYKVKSGDSLSALAKHYNTTTHVIKNANDLSSDSIRIGQFLMIPTSTKDDAAYILSASNRLAKAQAKSRGQYKLMYTVRSGDSLWTIARANKVSHQSLAKWNGMGPKDTLRVGQNLVIWKKTSQGAVIRTVFYSVKNGDTINAIANRFKVKSNDIVKWNDLAQQKYLQPGQKLKLYIDVTKVSV
ncbi:lytic transglycosylase [Vibrio zhanjiangensis]|uniref:Lytic transglycosylase n=1 Tax=Vibrio zhanjiangensis TaxID=1046128 RepID=A0ABQ6EW89_9VIBR|nr:LysM peptidoglycan-binding domain-containing protein [Vibrio zhanjiangensis]GLT17264.1 lytic transglycosylase [Vibrio zhanjiangensis]